MRAAYDAYLHELRQILGGLKPERAEAILREAQARLDHHLARLAWEAAHLPPDAAWARALAEVGTPSQAAERLLALTGREDGSALRPAPRPSAPVPPAPPRPWPGFLAILREPEAYASLLYLVLASITGLAYLTWITTALSLSLGLVVVLVGLPLLLLALASFRALGRVERGLAESLLGAHLPVRHAMVPPGRGLLGRLGALLTDGHTWRVLLYLGLMLPLGLAYLGLLAAGVGTSLALASTPAALLVAARMGLPVEGMISLGPGLTYSLASAPAWLTVGVAFLGLLGLIGCLHLALALGRLHGRLAGALLA